MGDRQVHADYSMPWRLQTGMHLVAMRLKTMREVIHD
jgi:hypothetical protein